MTVKVGCCGLPVSLSKYTRDFSLVEVQKTFYRLPRRSTVESWRARVPEDFCFTVKAWQALTHLPSSPTWRKYRGVLEDLNLKELGGLRPTDTNFAAWKATLEVCYALGAGVCIIQTPPSFRCTPENLDNLHSFFSSLERGYVRIGIELRGNWADNPGKIMDVCDKHDLIPVTDLLRRRPIIVGEVVYSRLHGLNPREYNYKYRYTDRDLNTLSEEVMRLMEEGVEEAYILFNNVEMMRDALRFKEAIRRRGPSLKVL